jgi:hypothetical protein
MSWEVEERSGRRQGLDAIVDGQRVAPTAERGALPPTTGPPGSLSPSVGGLRRWGSRADFLIQSVFPVLVSFPRRVDCDRLSLGVVRVLQFGRGGFGRGDPGRGLR